MSGELSVGMLVECHCLERMSGNLSRECPDPDAELHVSTCSGYDLCHPG